MIRGAFDYSSNISYSSIVIIPTTIRIATIRTIISHTLTFIMSLNHANRSLNLTCNRQGPSLPSLTYIKLVPKFPKGSIIDSKKMIYWDKVLDLGLTIDSCNRILYQFYEEQIFADAIHWQWKIEHPLLLLLSTQ